MKFIAYVEKIVPIEVEVDDKWKPMEEYGNTPPKKITYQQDNYFDVNESEFLTDICKALEGIGESGHNLHSIDTTIGGTVMEDLQEY